MYRCVAVRTVVVEEGVAIVAPLKTVATGCFDVKREKGIAKGSEYVRTLEWQHLSGTVIRNCVISTAFAMFWRWIASKVKEQGKGRASEELPRFGVRKRGFC